MGLVCVFEHSEHFQCVISIYCNLITKEEARLDTVFQVLLLTMRSPSFEAVLAALDVTCGSVIDEPVSEGET